MEALNCLGYTGCSVGGFLLDSSGSGRDLLKGCCEEVHELLSSIKDAKIVY